jgi:methyl-accepting chemotaxis protein
MINLFRQDGSDAALKALDRSMAIIEFDPRGNILSANENFCQAIGYTLAEIKGRHHSMFVEADYAKSSEYAAFWAKLAQGEFDAREYKRLAKGGREIWIQASYNPVLSSAGKVVRVIKAATEITAAKLRSAEFEGKIKAISRVQAVIEFTPTGEILGANENFLAAVGYAAAEVVGRHHRMFVDPEEAQSPRYQAFWATLNRGEFVAAEFRRIGKGGREVWIQASYNPILDPDDKVTKVVKFATVITDRIEAVDYVGRGMTGLAGGDLEARLDKTLVPAFEPLRMDFNKALDQLQSTMVQVAAGAGAIDSGAREISTASDDLSRRTEQQAASLEETAAALDQITATVRKTAEGARHASQVVAAAKSDAEQSEEVVGQAIAAMGGIERSSREISNIIGVIDEIAFQTNLLALNAGVEAARAGDAGRGFAVVASEVRALAQRSAQAAKEIKALISTSTTEVTAGVGLVSQTGKALQRIVAKITDIDGVVNDIAASAQEQATALHEVNTAVNQMDQVTQQNAAMVEETTAASHALAKEAEDLAQLVGQFTVGAGADQGGRSAWAAPAPRAAAPPPRAVMRPVGRGGAAVRPALSVVEESWEEF